MKTFLAVLMCCAAMLVVCIIGMSVPMRADEPAQPKQVLIPFNSLEKVAVSGVLSQLDAMRREKCKIEGIDPANCGGITPDGVYKLIPTKPETK